MDSKQLKLLALSSMFFDHFIRIFPLSDIIYPLGNWCTSIGLYTMGTWLITWLPHMLIYFGRLAAPIFMFCIVQGFLHTKNIKKYLLRIFATAFLAQIPYILFELAENRMYGIQGSWTDVSMNILFTLGLGLLSLWSFTKCQQKGYTMLGISLIILSGILARLLRFEGSEGYILIIFMLYILRNSSLRKKILLFIPIVILSRYRLIFYTLANPEMLRVCFLNVFGPYLGLLVTCSYTHKKGNIHKLFQNFTYIFYPLHLFILAIIGYLRSPFT
ncbi:TraX family protein [Anaerocolumna cellulosilytica]|uniref:TraX family protein n=1 Tax=Anaerocolumna cellulosilytica TaxID=433286 RepID=UPI00161E71F3|nr:TraX family protein [Anaerocolumna cellulosilytica]MBB5194300.1 hypothetical protein [Anaerocolumna cellulosilytica]